MPEAISDLIRRQLTIGQLVTFTLRDGGSAHGQLEEIGESHVTLDTETKLQTILIDQISGWDATSQPSAVTGSDTDVVSIEQVAEFLDSIYADFVSGLMLADVDLEGPSFGVDVRESANSAAIKRSLQPLRDKYDYAVKVNEFDPKFGRIQDMIAESKSLCGEYPASPTVRRIRSHLQLKSGDRNAATEGFRRVASDTDAPADWITLAHVLAHDGKSLEAIGAIARALSHAMISTYPTAWRTYVFLLSSTGSTETLADITSAACQAGDEDQLLRGLLYLLIQQDEEEARSLATRFLAGHHLVDLCRNATSRLLGIATPEEPRTDDISGDRIPVVRLTTVSLAAAKDRVRSLVASPTTGVASQAQALTEALDAALEMLQQTSFEGREAAARTVERLCESQLGRWKGHADSSAQIIRSITELQAKVRAWRHTMYSKANPDLSLDLPIGSFFVDGSGQFELQVAVHNKSGRSPAEQAVVSVEVDPDYAWIRREPPTLSSVAGGASAVVPISMRVTSAARKSIDVPISMNVTYRTIEGKSGHAEMKKARIQILDAKRFVEIDSPYAQYCEGGIVGDRSMFFGRDELIDHLAQAIESSRTQSKSIVIFGQKRAGKSSVLHHLKTWLEQSDHIIVLNVDNVASLLDEASETPLLHHLLWRIVSLLARSVEDKIAGGAPELGLSFPSWKDFYDHPSPLLYFGETLEGFRAECAKSSSWSGTRIVLLIDEFSYLYDRILEGKLPASFMQNWKALLQADHFSVVAAGQDVMPKFKERFPNEFGTSQDERITYLGKVYAERLIEYPLRIEDRDGESRFKEGAVERIMRLTAGSPFYIQIICHRLVQHMNTKRTNYVTQLDVEQVKDDLIRGVNALSISKFDNLISSGDTSADAISDSDTLEALKSIAKSSADGWCPKSKINCQTKAAVADIVHDLTRRDVLLEDGNSCRIQVGLFEEWLTAHPQVELPS